MSLFHRRDFLVSASRAALLAAGSGFFRGAAWALPEKLGVPQGRSAEKIRGFPFAELDSFLTPTDQFFLRSHLEIPTIHPDQYRLQIGGLVERPYSLGLGELERMSRSSYPATFECSGSAVGGGMVSTAEWSGVELWKLLERAKPKGGAVEVVMEGSDAGLDELVPIPVQFARSVPIPVLRGIPGLLVMAMNGAPLRPEHGYPARALLPGLYGVQNVKWLARLTVVNKPYQGFYQTQRYVGLRETPQGVRMEEILRQRVKSQIARVFPRPEAGKGAYRVTGAAWSGGRSIVQVEVSLDGGRQWRKADLSPAKNEYSWVLWSQDFTAPPGSYEVVARATDSAGQVQPLERDPSILTGYVNNWCDRKSLTVPA
ncbi:MAG: sulfite oxidase [Acidobacteria bacterium]|nr:sulfite oxidase [Acidobacteriota bacterium]